MSTTAMRMPLPMPEKSHLTVKTRVAGSLFEDKDLSLAITIRQPPQFYVT
jgi:hypothetical protein